ncbi:uncharacterized protein N7511_010018 [Penicillium nucicola]|uniref:uncharacterized protein n=1 Tax=Penicillium nucicola TaxID=1850975 RepID=UPI00254512D3|nr:uncharacterized protein N7511_010018 [Penicillium nucicola]KAJ5748322.1 hypothetical protein N7511_010018 [Penicillium nucicola]
MPEVKRLTMQRRLLANCVGPASCAVPEKFRLVLAVFDLCVIDHVPGASCHYDYTRNKPGVKIGIIQTLSQRVGVWSSTLTPCIDSLEAELKSVKAQQQAASSILSPPNAGSNANAVRDLVSSLMQEWRETHDSPCQPQHPLTQPTVEADANPQSISPALATPHHPPSNKRRCPDTDIREGSSPSAAHFPPDNLLNALLDAYFSVVHPFIPMLHEMVFRSRLRDPTERPKLIVLIHAMMVCALRYVANERLAEEWLQLQPDSLKKSRELVVLSAMEGMSVENVQALLLVAFVHISDGDARKAWPMVGTLARAAVYLGLHAEPEEDQPGERCLTSFRSLSSAQVWTEAEERRRVFWNIFLLDRFCSTTTGWNISLSIEDVQVRLPSDGLYWVKEEPVTTPFFNIWNNSEGKIGKSVSFLPSYLSSLADKEVPQSGRVSLAPEARKPDASTIGSFAHCVEATESLNRVVKFFLQQTVNFGKRREFSAWLTRFKELDLQLIQRSLQKADLSYFSWKMFLPRRWKDSNISKEPAFVHMDPNLTLAHITHNTSMILLHQCIAYPRAKILEKLRLANTGSVETCQLAASETANIVQKYMQYTPFVGLVNPQFSFCTFISARVILVHAHIHRTEIPEAYGVLLSSLQQMSDRWVSMNPNLKLRSETRNFAEGLILQLRTVAEKIGSFSFDIAASDYIAEVNSALGMEAPATNTGQSQWIQERRAQQRHSIIPVNARQSHYMDTNRLLRGADQQSPLDPIVAPPLRPVQSDGIQPGNFRSMQPIEVNPSRSQFEPPNQDRDIALDGLFPPTDLTPSSGDGLDGFAPLSNFLLDPQFVDMDRIISFQDSFRQY